MKSYTLPIPSARFSIFFALFLLTFMPALTSAASLKPSCELEVKTQDGTVTTEKNEDILLVKGDTVQITWESKNAKTATMGSGRVIALEGVATNTPSTTTMYSYRFVSGSKRVTCAVTVHVVTGTITESTLTSKSSKPTLSGKAVGTKSVQLTIYKEGTGKVVYTSNVIKVKNDAWKAHITKKLVRGTYDVVLSGEKSLELNTILKETLTIGKVVKNPKTDEKADTTFVVVPVPLLLGGTARGGSSVSVSYLQVINIGKEPASLSGFRVMQNGSAFAEAVTGFTVVDDTGIFRGATGSGTLFKNSSAFVPIEVSFASGQMRLFTIKAILGNNVSTHLGKQLKIDVIGVEATAAIRSTFPIRGTTWTIGL